MRPAPARPDPAWRWRSDRPDAATLAWLRDPGSLTARLRQLAGGQLQVRVTRLAWLPPTLAERLALGIPAGEWALVREVVLEGRGEPWVVARSVIPRHTLTGANRRLASLGEKPLGAFLFRDPTLRREKIVLSRLARPAAGNPWGRRSTFLLRGAPLTVAEYFLPALLARSPRPPGPG
jgi:chorismate--pyruvate lyase